MATADPDHLVLVMLREILSIQEAHSERFEHLEDRLKRLEKQLDELSKVVRYTLGQSAETPLKQSEQESRVDELFEKVEKLLSERQPS